MSSTQQVRTHPFTCNSCQVAFKTSELQRTHMQSDWHRYNLKRRIASLPPLSSDIFTQKVLASKASAAATAARATFEKQCAACRKSFYSENAFSNHLRSAKHRANAAKGFGHRRDSQDLADAEVGSVMSSTFDMAGSIGSVGTLEDGATAERDVVPPEPPIEEEAEEEFEKVVRSLKSTSLKGKSPLARRPTRPHQTESEAVARPDSHPLSDTRPNSASPPPSDGSARATPHGHMTKQDALRSCLFCSSRAPDLDGNLEHMRKVHGLFIPEREYLIDVEGLACYLSAKVRDEYKCLYCNRLKWTEDGIKTHMRDAEHCKIAYDTESQMLEIGRFYDFRSTYSDLGDDSEEEMEGEEDGEYHIVGNSSSSKPEAANGDDDEGWETSSSVSSVPTSELGSLHADRDPRRHLPVTTAYQDEFELHLPTGRIAGHRSLGKYFRQNLHRYPTAAEKAERRMIEAVEREARVVEGAGDVNQEEDRGRRTERGLVRREHMGMVGVSTQKRREVLRAEMRARRGQDWEAMRGKFRNRNFQKHYRDPLLQ